MIWRPLDLATTCPAHTQLTACSHFGYVYLNLLVQLYGDAFTDGSKGDEDHHNIEGDKVVEILKNYEDSREKHDGKGDRRKSETDVYDFIVVGAGSAGCVVANRLSEVKEWKVLLLEAGIEQPDISKVPSLAVALLGSNVDWKYNIQPDGKSCLARVNGCPWPRGKMMGGSSSINSFVYVRGNKLDYDGWAALGNDGWSYKDVLPYFKKSENNLNIKFLNPKYHGVEGEQSVSQFPYIDKPSSMLTEALSEVGLPIIDINGPNQMGTMQAQTISRDGARVSTNTAFIEPIRYKRKNLTVKSSSEAVEILIDEHNRAYGVKYIRKGKVYTAISKKEVIVSSGAINSPKLLLLSGIGPKEHLESLGIRVKQELAVGENLHDHVTFNGLLIALSNKTATTVYQDEVLDIVYKNKISKKNIPPLSGNGAVSTIAFYKTDPNLPAPDMQVQVNSVLWREFVREPINFVRHTIFPDAFYDGLAPRVANLVPKSRGVLLLNSTDPYGPPLLYANYFAEEEDLIRLLKGIRLILSLQHTEAFKLAGAHFVTIPLPACKYLSWGTGEYFACIARAYTSSSYHPAGSCKMGPIWDRKAVVDPRLRVYGMSGLRVIDASIMPYLIRGNTNAPSIMIGERGVAFVKEDWMHKHN